VAGISSLNARCSDHSKLFFRNICQSDSCLYHLLTWPQDPDVTSCLPKPTVYPKPRYRSTVSYSLLDFQQCNLHALTYTFTVLLLHQYFCCFHTVFYCVYVYCITVKSSSRSFWNNKLYFTAGLQLFPLHHSCDDCTRMQQWTVRQSTARSSALFTGRHTIHRTMYSIYCTAFRIWLRGPAVEHRSLAGVLSLSCAQPVADE